ncbi:S-layer homology domain-containing protein [Arthrobacter sp. Hz1]
MSIPTTVSGCGSPRVAPLMDVVIPDGDPGAVTVSPDGSRVYVSLTNLGDPGSGVISVLDSETLEEVAAMQVPGHYPYAGKVHMNPAGTKGYLATNTGTVQVFDAATNTMTTSIPKLSLTAIAFSPDESRVYITGRNHSITVVDALTDTVIDEWIYDDNIYGNFRDIEIDPTSSLAYVGDVRWDSVFVVDLKSGSIIDDIPVGGPVRSLTLTKDGKSLYVVNNYNQRSVIVNTVTRSIESSFYLETGNLLLSESEDRAYVSDVTQNRVSVIDLTTNALICSHTLLPAHTNYPGDIALSPDGKRIYVAQDSSADKRITVLSIADERNVTFRDVNSRMQFDREIRWLANAGITTGHDDGTYRPLEPVRRDAMAAFLYRFHGSPDFTPPSASPFIDLRTTDKFYKEITWLVSMGIAEGWPDRTFRPLTPVNRDAMAAFMFRTVDHANFAPPATSPYTDVKKTDQFYPEMAFMSSSGVTTGWPDGTFRPVQPVNRDAMAAFLFRLNPLASSLDR